MYPAILMRLQPFSANDGATVAAKGAVSWYSSLFFASNPARILLDYWSRASSFLNGAEDYRTRKSEDKITVCGWTDKAESHNVRRCRSKRPSSVIRDTFQRLFFYSTSHAVLKSQLFPMPQSCMLDVAILGPSLTALSSDLNGFAFQSTRSEKGCV
jgi:hypothetical protein